MFSILHLRSVCVALNTDLEKFAEEVNESMEKLVKETAFIMFRDITTKTAIDEGTLKASLQINAEKPDLTTVAPKGSTYIPVPSVGKLDKNNPAIFITNNQPYAQRVLNEGWSQQTEVNMANDSVQRAFIALKKKYS